MRLAPPRRAEGALSARHVKQGWALNSDRVTAILPRIQERELTAIVAAAGSQRVLFGLRRRLFSEEPAAGAWASLEHPHSSLRRAS